MVKDMSIKQSGGGERSAFGTTDQVHDQIQLMYRPTLNSGVYCGQWCFSTGLLEALL